MLGTAALDADDRITYEQNSGKLWFDADGSGIGATVLFAVLDNRVKVGEKSISSIAKSEYRRSIGSVAQGDMLYAGSLAENIASFDPAIDIERVHDIAQLAHIHDEIQAMPLGYETLVPAKHTLDQLGIARRTFYRWCDRFLEGEPGALADWHSAPSRVQNRIRIGPASRRAIRLVVWFDRHRPYLGQAPAHAHRHAPCGQGPAAFPFRRDRVLAT